MNKKILFWTHSPMCIHGKSYSQIMLSFMPKRMTCTWLTSCFFPYTLRYPHIVPWIFLVLIGSYTHLTCLIEIGIPPAMLGLLPASESGLVFRPHVIGSDVDFGSDISYSLSFGVWEHNINNLLFDFDFSSSHYHRHWFFLSATNSFQKFIRLFGNVFF